MSYYTVKQMAMRYPAFTEAALWDYIFHRKTNGFRKCTSKIKNKRIIYDAEFNQWVIEQGNKYDRPKDIALDTSKMEGGEE